MRSKVMIVDDDAGVLRAMEHALQPDGYNLVARQSPGEALEAFGSAPCAAVLADQRMPQMEGITFLERVRERSPDTARLLLTGCDDQRIAVDAINRAGVCGFITKPWDVHALRLLVREAVTRYELVVENKRLEAMHQVHSQEMTRLGARLSEARRTEIETAAQIQEWLLQGSAPRLERVEVACLTVPSSPVDGDFYEFFVHAEDCLDIVVGDVMGKGVPAALVSAAVKSQFVREMARLRGGPPPPAAIVAAVQRVLGRRLLELETFVTLCYVRLDAARGVAEIVDCGHPPVVLASGEGGWRTVRGGHQPLGFCREETYDSVTTAIAPGEVMVIYSDGLTEVMDAKGEMLGLERVGGAVRDWGSRPVEGLPHALQGVARAFSASEHLTDDLTCVAVRIPGYAAEARATGDDGQAMPAAAAAVDGRHGD